MHYRMLLAGLHAKRIFSAPDYHFGSRTTAINPHLGLNSEGGKAEFLKKWGAMPSDCMDGGGRIMVHWFSQNERSMKMSIWNTSHTVGSGMLGNLAAVGTMLLGGLFIVDIGGGIMVEQTWRSVFVFPAIVALAIAVFCWWALRDTPQSCGLPPIDKYRNDLTAKVDANGGEKIPFSKLFVDYIFKNRVLWIIAIANAFVYLVIVTGKQIGRAHV